MTILSELSLKIHRYLLILPPSVSIQDTRKKVLGRLLSAPAAPAIEPLPHPIDRHYEIQTSGNVGFNELRCGKASDIYNVSYGGSQPSIIRKVLATIPDLDHSTFLDLGCGKGRAVAVASEFPFREIIGVELVPAMARIAQANAETMQRRFPERTPIRIIEGDALTTPMPEGQVVIFFYHPFFKALMKKVADNIEATVARNPKNKIFVIYLNPVYACLYDKLSSFRRYFADTIDYDSSEMGAGVDYHDQWDSVVIWESKGPAMAEPHANAQAPVTVIPPGWRATTRGDLPSSLPHALARRVRSQLRRSWRGISLRPSAHLTTHRPQETAPSLSLWGWFLGLFRPSERYVSDKAPRPSGAPTASFEETSNSI